MFYNYRGRWVCNDCKHGIRHTKRARANRNKAAAERAAKTKKGIKGLVLLLDNNILYAIE